MVRFNRIISLGILFGLVMIQTACRKDSKLLLSNLNADAKSPLYSTYAAAMERSEFTLDEGYELKYYDDNSGVELTTDTGGDITMGFKTNGKWIYKVGDFFRKPVITKSYPDMVYYHFSPFDGLMVNSVFLVQSSHSAILEVDLKNKSNHEIEFDLIPFIKNQNMSFDSVSFETSDNRIIFTHDEFPDSWTIEQKLPYVSHINNVFLTSEPFDSSNAFNSISNEAVYPLAKNTDNLKSVYRVTGRSKFLDGKRNLELSPVSRIQIYVNNDTDRLITENSPVLGINQNVISKGGYFTNELGLLKKVRNGDFYTFTFYLESEKLGGSYTQVIKNSGEKQIRNDIVLSPYSKPLPPTNLKLTRKDKANTISWESENQDNSKDLRFNVYRRDYPDGIYKLVAKNIATNSFVDSQLDTTIVHGYILASVVQNSIGIHSREVTDIPTISFDDFVNKDTHSNLHISNRVKLIGMSKRVLLKKGEHKKIRFVRTVERPSNGLQDAIKESKELLHADFTDYLSKNEKLFSKVISPAFQSKEQELLYWSAFNMMRQVFLPAEAKSKYNYYVFSREPTWGWGHGGQVFHESITMLSYVMLDPTSAMNSQRVFSQRQYENGYINYRTGSYLDEKIEYNNELTSSAPWYAWINFEVYKQTGDKEFLKEMYQSSKKYYNFFVVHRDKDNDGLCEWNGHAVLESVRDALVAVWDNVGWPANFEGVDINSMLVMEAKSLEEMARALGLTVEADIWKADWQKRAELINKTFWDKETGFYYNVNKKDHTFTFNKPNDLKRKEIIGFLPLWAGIVPENRVDSLLKHLLNKQEFWREYGIPSLSADDSYYNDKGYWNGPVWVEWNYLIVQGLLKYGRKNEAREIVDHVSKNMIEQLKKDHNLWEFYSPDEQWAGYNKTYIWAGIINRMILDTNK